MDLGMALDAATVKRCVNTDLNLQTALVDMYAKCGNFGASEAVFWRMPCWDTTSWNSMIGGSTVNGLSDISAQYFREMMCLAVQADEVTLSSVLSAASRADDLLSFGESVHGCVIKLGCEDTASLITFCSDLGFPNDVENVFAGISSKTLVSWNAMIDGLLENEKVSEALFVFQEMISGYQPDHATLVTVISGCADQGLLCEGKEIHGYIVRKGLLHEESSIGNNLLGLYMKSHDSFTAKLLFGTIWNTMLSGYSRDNLLGVEAQAMFRELLSKGNMACELLHQYAVCLGQSCDKPALHHSANDHRAAILNLAFRHFTRFSKFSKWHLMKMLTRGLSVRQHNTIECQGKAKIQLYENTAMMAPKGGMLQLGLD